MSSVTLGGQLIQRISQFNEVQTRRPLDNSMEFWRNFTNEFFAESAVLKYSIVVSNSMRTFELPYKVLARFFMLNYAAGMRESTYLLDNPKESLIEGFPFNATPYSASFFLDSNPARILSVFENIHVYITGSLRITFAHNLKILSWEFDALKHEEFYSKVLLEHAVALLTQKGQQSLAAENGQGEDHQLANNAVGGGISLEESNINLMQQLNELLAAAPNFVNEYGISPQIMRCYEIAEIVSSMEDLMDLCLQSNNNSPKDALERICATANGLQPTTSNPSGLHTHTLPPSPAIPLTPDVESPTLSSVDGKG